MNQRTMTGPLDHHVVRELADAEGFAKRLGYELRTTINVSPWLLHEYPADLRGFFDAFLNKLRLWCRRRGFGFHAIGVRENFEGDRREHFHVLLYVPARQREALEEAVRRWLPGDEGVVEFGRAKIEPDRYGRAVNKALTYMLKQMTQQARVSLNWRVRRQPKCSKTDARVAPVLGKRHFISRSLNMTARTRLAAGTARPARNADTAAA